MRALPQPGPSLAALAAQMVVYTTEEGAVCVAVPVQLVDSEVKWTGKHTVTLVKRDGSVQQRRQQELMRIFEWDGIDLAALQEVEPGKHQFEVVGEHEAYTPEGSDEERTRYKIAFMNPIGGSSNMPERLTESALKSLSTRFSSKLKASAGASGGSKRAAAPAPAASDDSAPEDEAPQQPAAPARKSSGPPGRRSNATSVSKRTSDQDSVWKALKAANPKKSEEDLAATYYGAIDEMFPDGSENLTPAQWGEVADKLGV